MSAPGPLGSLRRIATAPRPSPAVEERCDMCSAPIADEHQHVVDIQGRSLMCCCRPCYLLFDRPGARLRYAAVPDRYLRLTDFSLGPAQWDALQIPVGLAFFFRNSTMDKVVAFYPGPAGATESELDLAAWESIAAANPTLGSLADDVEAVLVRSGNDGYEGYIVPIDSCYELVGTLRMLWRGFDGGQEARAEIDAFFERVAARSQDA